MRGGDEGIVSVHDPKQLPVCDPGGAGESYQQLVRRPPRWGGHVRDSGRGEQALHEGLFVGGEAIFCSEQDEAVEDLVNANSDAHELGCVESGTGERQETP